MTQLVKIWFTCFYWDREILTAAIGRKEWNGRSKNQSGHTPVTCRFLLKKKIELHPLDQTSATLLVWQLHLIFIRTTQRLVHVDTHLESSIFFSVWWWVCSSQFKWITVLHVHVSEGDNKIPSKTVYKHVIHTLIYLFLLMKYYSIDG